ncbi:MAG: hypothetical protein ABI823_02090 [Bryobacteraceae bacterium]
MLDSLFSLVAHVGPLTALASGLLAHPAADEQQEPEAPSAVAGKFLKATSGADVQQIMRMIS